ncbi:hypothetical protein ACR9JY_03100 [Helicobacter pylori]
MQERVFKRKVLDANILKEMHANNVCYSKHSKDRFIPFRFDKSRYVEGKNHCHIVSGSHQVGGVRKVISRFNTKKPPFSLDSTLKTNPFDTGIGLGV